MRVRKLWQLHWSVDPPFWKSNAQDDPHVAVAAHCRALEGLENLAYVGVQWHIGQVGQRADHQGLKNTG